MKKRILAAVLWFVVGWQGGGLLASTIGLPWMLGTVLGIACAGLVLWDPKRIFRPVQRSERHVVEVTAYAGRLDKWIEHWPAVESDSTRV